MLAEVEQELFRRERVARILDISPARVSELLADGSLRSLKIGRSRRITRQAITDYIAQLEAAQV